MAKRRQPGEPKWQSMQQYERLLGLSLSIELLGTDAYSVDKLYGGRIQRRDISAFEFCSNCDCITVGQHWKCWTYCHHNDADTGGRWNLIFSPFIRRQLSLDIRPEHLG